MQVSVALCSKAWVYGRSPAEILGLIPPKAWMYVSCECCVLSGRGLCDELITRPEESYRLWCVVVCDQETSWMRRPWPALDCSAIRKINLPSEDAAAHQLKLLLHTNWRFCGIPTKVPAAQPTEDAAAHQLKMLQHTNWSCFSTPTEDAAAPQLKLLEHTNWRCCSTPTKDTVAHQLNHIFH